MSILFEFSSLVEIPINDPGDIFKWPIITEEDELAVLNMLKYGKMLKV